MSRSSVERILGGTKGTLLTYLPGGLLESSLEKYALDALPKATAGERTEFIRYWRDQIWRQRERLDRASTRAGQPFQAPLTEATKAKPPVKTPATWLEECKVHTKVRSHERQAELMCIERSVYFDLKKGRKVGDATYIKAAQYITEPYAPCMVHDLKPPAD